MFDGVDMNHNGQN